MEEKENNKLTMLGIGFGVGLLVGGILALLYAPVEGKKAREIVREKIEEIKSKFPKKTTNIDKVHRQ
jgi:gas vesicle protein